MVISAFSVSMAQTIKGAVGISMVPLWPADGNIPESLKQQYVFFEPSTGMLVVSYPERLENPDGSDKRTAPLRIPMNNNVEPTMTFNISRTQEGIYEYGYQVSNGPSAKQDISNVSIVINQSKTMVDRFNNWNGLIGSAPLTPQVLLISNGKAEKLMIWISRPEGNIRPGRTLSSFHATS